MATYDYQKPLRSVTTDSPYIRLTKGGKIWKVVCTLIPLYPRGTWALLQDRNGNKSWIKGADTKVFHVYFKKPSTTKYYKKR